LVEDLKKEVLADEQFSSGKYLSSQTFIHRFHFQSVRADRPFCGYTQDVYYQTLK